MLQQCLNSARNRRCQLAGVDLFDEAFVGIVCHEAPDNQVRQKVGDDLTCEIQFLMGRQAGATCGDHLDIVVSTTSQFDFQLQPPHVIQREIGGIPDIRIAHDQYSMGLGSFPCHRVSHPGANSGGNGPFRQRDGQMSILPLMIGNDDSVMSFPAVGCHQSASFEAGENPMVEDDCHEGDNDQ